jgi:hypothetical protein
VEKPWGRFGFIFLFGGGGVVVFFEGKKVEEILYFLSGFAFLKANLI